jgi:hypothetical protein
MPTATASVESWQRDECRIDAEVAAAGDIALRAREENTPPLISDRVGLIVGSPQLSGPPDANATRGLRHCERGV